MKVGEHIEGFPIKVIEFFSVEVDKFITKVAEEILKESWIRLTLCLRLKRAKVFCEKKFDVSVCNIFETRVNVITE